jgi:hypothetical protein
LRIPLEVKHGRNFERPPWCYLLWGVPAVFAVAAAFAYQQSVITLTVAGIIWTSAVAWAGIGCLINARSCGRVHCIIDGIGFPLLALTGVLNVLSLVSFSWNLFWDAFLVILVISFIPELVWKRYSQTRIF